VPVPGLWLRDGAAARALAPLAGCYGAAAALRRRAYERGWLARPDLPLPVIVVGNLFVGGTGKTPFVAWLVERLQARGWSPGVVARGYGGRAGAGPTPVRPSSDPGQVGDEPLLLAGRTRVPVYVGSDRAGAVAAAYGAGCDVVVSDDGLQHYRMRRSTEIVILDAERRLGNRRLLPAGPLREAPSRLREVALVAVNGDPIPESRCAFHLQAGIPQAVDGAQRPWPGGPAHLVAGIGRPEAFFATAAAAGFQAASRHPLPDHHAFRARDLAFEDDRPVLMTEKDAVKARHLPQARRAWYLPAELVPTPALSEAVDGVIDTAAEERRG